MRSKEYGLILTRWLREYLNDDEACRFKTICQSTLGERGHKYLVLSRAGLEIRVPLMRDDSVSYAHSISNEWYYGAVIRQTSNDVSATESPSLDTLLLWCLETSNTDQNIQYWTNLRDGQYHSHYRALNLMLDDLDAQSFMREYYVSDRDNQDWIYHRTQSVAWLDCYAGLNLNNVAQWDRHNLSFAFVKTPEVHHLEKWRLYWQSLSVQSRVDVLTFMDSIQRILYDYNSQCIPNKRQTDIALGVRTCSITESDPRES